MGRPLSARIPTNEVIALYEAGHTATDIAERLHTVQSVILRRLDRYGVGRRRRGNISPIPIASIVAMYETGANVGQVARRFKVSKTAVKWRLKKAGIPIRQHVFVDRTGSANHQWRGGVIVTRGYVKVNVGDGKYIFEHRRVVAERLGRDLKPGEIVHHLNGIRNDNRSENLRLTTRQDHEHYTYVKCLQARVRELESHLKSHG